MRVVFPEVSYAYKSGGMAPRPDSLEGKVLGILQNHGSTGLGEGELERGYPYVQLADALTSRYGVESVVWFAKPMLSMVAPAEQRDSIVELADIIITGLCQ
jgi:hypothetical protein